MKPVFFLLLMLMLFLVGPMGWAQSNQESMRLGELNRSSSDANDRADSSQSRSKNLRLSEEQRPRNQKGPKSKEQMLLDDVDAILKPAFNSSIDKKSPLLLKRGGQDGGGGSGEEAEFNFLLNLQIQKMRPYLALIRQIELLSAEQLKIFEETFPKNSKTSNVCVVILEKDISDICPIEKKKIFVPVSEWKSLKESEKKLRVSREILKIFGIVNSANQAEIEAQLQGIVDEKRDRFHYFTVQGSSVFRNKNSGEYYSFEIQKAAGEFKFVVQDSSRQQQIYKLNANSGYFNLNPCAPENAQDPYEDLMNPEYVYRELKSFAVSCQKLVASGRQPRSFWVSEKTNLVFKCD